MKKGTHVTITVQLSVGEGARSWRDPSGEDNFQVTVPVDAMEAVNIQKLLPAMLAVAKADFIVKAEKYELENIKVEEVI